jgi:hypothetical protein
MSKEAVMTYFEVQPRNLLQETQEIWSIPQYPGRDTKKAPLKHKIKVLLLENKLAEFL